MATINEVMTDCVARRLSADEMMGELKRRFGRVKMSAVDLRQRYEERLAGLTAEPPKDGTRIIACGNIIEVDEPLRSAFGFGPITMTWQDGHWIDCRTQMSVIQFVDDEIHVHWWTEVDA